MPAALQDEWHQYEEGALQLIEQLTAALAKQHSKGEASEASAAALAAAKAPAAWGSPHNTDAPVCACARVCMRMHGGNMCVCQSICVCVHVCMCMCVGTHRIWPSFHAAMHE